VTHPRRAAQLLVSIAICSECFAGGFGSALGGMGAAGQGMQDAADARQRSIVLQQQIELNELRLQQMKRQQQLEDEYRRKKEEELLALEEIRRQQQREEYIRQQDDQYVKATLDSKNAGGPHMVAKNVRFDSAVFFGRTMSEQYSKIDMTLKQMHKIKGTKFEDVVRGLEVTFRNITCSDLSGRRLLYMGIVRETIIRSKNNEFVARFGFVEKDCV
jgi:hypothetical protein